MIDWVNSFEDNCQVICTLFIVNTLKTNSPNFTFLFKHLLRVKVIFVRDSEWEKSYNILQILRYLFYILIQGFPTGSPLFSTICRFYLTSGIAKDADGLLCYLRCNCFTFLLNSIQRRVDIEKLYFVFLLDYLNWYFLFKFLWYLQIHCFKPRSHCKHLGTHLKMRMFFFPANSRKNAK